MADFNSGAIGGSMQFILNHMYDTAKGLKSNSTLAETSTASVTLADSGMHLSQLSSAQNQLLQAIGKA